MSKEVEPDYKHAWKLYKSILMLPIILLLVLFRKRNLEELLEPFKVLWEYFWEARFTAWLIVVNVVVHVVLLFVLGGMGAAQQQAFAQRYLLDGPSNLLSFNVIPFVANWFFHGSWGHLLGNVLMLLILGRVVEKNFGTGKFALIYFGSAVVSGLVDDLVHIADLGYYASGASGAIAGLASAAMLVEPFYLVCILIIPIPVFVFGWLQVYTDVTGVLGGSDGTVANFAHLGGFFAIAVLAFFLSKEDKSKLWRGILINLGTLLVVGAVWWFTKG
jgi:membrane associated rhomboid family serine protease